LLKKNLFSTLTKWEYFSFSWLACNVHIQKVLCCHWSQKYLLQTIFFLELREWRNLKLIKCNIVNYTVILFQFNRMQIQPRRILLEKGKWMPFFNLWHWDNQRVWVMRWSVHPWTSNRINTNSGFHLLVSVGSAPSVL